jgi:uncharacterized protein
MKCPIDGTDLMISDRNGIEIDYCPKCRGVWLDRGELDKIIERAAQMETQRYSSQPRNGGYGSGDNYFDDDDDYKRKNDSYYGQPGYHDPRKKRKSVLGEIFDIFD